MIIRYTVYDNDYTNEIKKFYKHIKFDNDVFRNNNDMEKIEQFEDLFGKYLYHKNEITENDVNSLNNLLYQKFYYYIKNEFPKDFIQNHSYDIEIVPMVSDCDRNGEYVYYFVETDQFIVL